MAVKIRLARRGRKKLAMYDVVVTQSRAPRDGVFIEKIGTYNPLTNPATININEDRALDWVMKGAQPTDTVRAMLSYKGVLIRKHLQVGVIKGAITQEEADKRYEEWKTKKDAQVNAKIEKLAQERDALLKDRHARETKVNQARAEALRQKQAARAKEEAAASQPEPAATEAPAETTATEEAPQQEPAAEAPAEKAPAQEPAAEVKEEPAAEAPAPEAQAPAEPEKPAEPEAKAPEEPEKPAEPEARADEKDDSRASE